MQLFAKVLLAVLFMFGGHASAHQFTPTYPRFETSFIDGVLQTKMELFNKRQEVLYYELGVFEADWKPISFATSDGRIIRVEYLETKNIDVYVKAQDIKKVVYICTESKLLKEVANPSVISSKICSKVKP